MKLSKATLGLLSISIVCLSNCNKDSVEKPQFTLNSADDFSAEEYEIYSLVLKETMSKSIVVAQRTSLSRFYFDKNYFQSLQVRNPAVELNLIDHYKQQNDSSYYFANKFSIWHKTVHLISADEIEYLFNPQNTDDGWEKFYDAYPGSNGITDLSRIGFNVRHDQALLEVGRQYAGLGGEGYLVYLEKTNNIWVIKEKIGTWIS